MAGDPFEPSQFFEVILPAILVERSSSTRIVDAVVQFVLTGTAQRAWAVDFTKTPASVEEGVHDSPALLLEIDPGLVIPIITGQVDVQAALTDGSLYVEGSPTILKRLERAFGKSSLISVRAVEKGSD